MTVATICSGSTSNSRCAFDEFQALVNQRRGVNRHDRTHILWSGAEFSRRTHPTQLIASAPAKGPPEAVSTRSATSERPETTGEARPRLHARPEANAWATLPSAPNRPARSGPGKRTALTNAPPTTRDSYSPAPCALQLRAASEDKPTPPVMPLRTTGVRRIQLRRQFDRRHTRPQRRHSHPQTPRGTCRPSTRQQPPTLRARPAPPRARVPGAADRAANPVIDEPPALRPSTSKRPRLNDRA